LDQIKEYMDAQVLDTWGSLHTQTMLILQEEAELEEIVQLVGYDSLSAPDRLTLEAARSIREDYLQQNGFDDVDTYTSLNKQVGMLQLVVAFYNKSKDALAGGADVADIFAMPVREKIARAKYVPEDQAMQYLADTTVELDAQVAALRSKEAADQ